MHVELVNFINRFEEKARRTGQLRRTIGKAELAFLEKVWGPAFHYNFDGLEPEFPWTDFKGGERFADFVYTKGGIKLLIEIDGYTTHAKNISEKAYEDHLERQNDLVLQGWLIIRFSARQVMQKPMNCQQKVTQAIGHWWATMNREVYDKGADIWVYRKKVIIQAAYQAGGVIHVADLSRIFGISPRTARDWAYRFVREGLIEPIRSKKQNSAYQLKDYEFRNAN